MTAIAVLGTGRMGTVHARNLRAADPTLELVFFDVSRNAATALCAHVAGRVADTLADALTGVDGAVVATPSDSHYDVARAAISRGITVFCEKPMVIGLTEADKIVTLAERFDVQVQVGFQRRCDPDYVALKNAVRSLRHGDPLLIRAVAADRWPPSTEFMAHSGGIVRDCLIHDLDVVPWMTGRDVSSVYAQGAILTAGSYAEHDDHDMVTVVLTLDGGAHAVLTASRTNPLGYDHRIEFLGTAGTASVGLDRRTPIRRTDEECRPETVYEDFRERFAAAYAAEMMAFLRLVAGDGENPCPAREARKALVLAEAVERSIRLGRPVNLTGPVRTSGL